jgi:hypothetical protein
MHKIYLIKIVLAFNLSIVKINSTNSQSLFPSENGIYLKGLSDFDAQGFIETWFRIQYNLKDDTSFFKRYNSC